ncbi:MAG: hypothetical protein ACTSYD_02025 [Candidatus Heimdallarchaeaceae archaeon]
MKFVTKYIQKENTKRISIKVMLLLVFFVMFLPAMFSLVDDVNVTWCEPSVSSFDVFERKEMNIVLTSMDENCTCYPSDYIYEGSWRNLYCLPEGKLKQARTVKIKIKPMCVDWEWDTEEREVDAEFCKKCPAPEVLTQWELVGCENSTKIYKRKIIAYFFNPTLDDCFKQNYAEFKFEKVESCRGIKTQPYIWSKIKKNKNNKNDIVLPEPQPEGFPVPSIGIILLVLCILIVIYVLYKGDVIWASLRRKKK